jgi:signal transduction histidine kinase
MIDTGYNRVQILFQDTGHGINQADLERIFDFYYSTKENGTGLGLAIVQQIVEEHHGRVIVDSRLNEGTTFIIELSQSNLSEV